MRNGQHWPSSGGRTMVGNPGSRVSVRSMTRIRPTTRSARNRARVFADSGVPAPAPPAPASAAARVAACSATSLTTTAPVRLPSDSRATGRGSPAPPPPDRRPPPRPRAPSPPAFARTSGVSLGGGSNCCHSSSIGPGNTFTTFTPPSRRSVRRHCESECAAASDADQVANAGLFTSAQIDSTFTHAQAPNGPSAPRSRRTGPELRGEAQQAEVVDVHLRPRGVDVLSPPDPPRAQVIAVVDEDLDFGPDPARKLVHRARIRHVERKDGDPGQLGEGRELGARVPRIGVPDVHLARPPPRPSPAPGPDPRGSCRW